jgi:hypothetical protein
MSAAEAVLSLDESFPNAQPENLANGLDSHSFTSDTTWCPSSDKVKVALSESSLDETIVKNDMDKEDMVRHTTVSGYIHNPNSI